ncbi:MAG: D-alanyl-D-alanine carboxypeptidase/D-alanyl-D-alanine-endopeptidase [Actinomycetota bacterium]
MSIRRLFRALVVLVVTLAPVTLVPSAIAGSASVGLSASAKTVTFGDEVTLSGAVTGDPSCDSDRTVELRWSDAGSAGFTIVEQGTTAADGTFSFVQSQPHTGRYRAVLPLAGECVRTVSDDVFVRVRALVDASLISGSSEAGSCVDVFVIVLPSKPGQVVDLQQRFGGTWTTVETLLLNGDGEGRANPCLGWDDIGVVQYRARWIPQDDLNLAGTSPTLAFEVTEAGWMRRIDDLVRRRAISVSVSEADAYLYRHDDLTPRTPASNEKLLLAMASLETFGAEHRITTRAAARTFAGGVVQGNLWVLGRGDPIVLRSQLGTLADQLVEAGLARVAGRVMGSTTYFRRDWDAPGWNDVARDYVNRPTALTFEFNRGAEPERGAAAALTRQLEERGVRIASKPGSGVPPEGLEALASIGSKPFDVLLAKMLRPSWNFAAEVLGKGLGAKIQGTPGTIAKGAASIRNWAAGRGVEFVLFDSSGLSYDNRVTAAGIVELLAQAEGEPWGGALRQALPTGGQGTLEDRLHDVRVRAKTGTLEDISALSGWVHSERIGAWIEFSILSAGMSKSTASEIEDRIVRILQNQAR